MTRTKERTLVLKRDCYDAEEISFYRKKGFRVKKVKFDIQKRADIRVDFVDSFVLNKPGARLEVELEPIEDQEDNIL